MQKYSFSHYDLQKNENKLHCLTKKSNLSPEREKDCQTNKLYKPNFAYEKNIKTRLYKNKHHAKFLVFDDIFCENLVFSKHPQQVWGGRETVQLNAVATGFQPENLHHPATHVDELRPAVGE